MPEFFTQERTSRRGGWGCCKGRSLWGYYPLHWGSSLSSFPSLPSVSKCDLCRCCLQSHLSVRGSHSPCPASPISVNLLKQMRLKWLACYSGQWLPIPSVWQRNKIAKNLAGREGGRNGSGGGTEVRDQAHPAGWGALSNWKKVGCSSPISWHPEGRTKKKLKVIHSLHSLGHPLIC